MHGLITGKHILRKIITAGIMEHGLFSRIHVLIKAEFPSVLKDMLRYVFSYMYRKHTRSIHVYMHMCICMYSHTCICLCVYTHTLIADIFLVTIY